MSKKILVVDDESSFTRLLKLNLESSGYEVQEENRGSNALSTALEFRPDVILLDLIMPDVDGANVAFQIRSMAELKGAKLFFLTALLTPEEVKRDKAYLCATPCIAKPVSVKEVIDRIEQEIQAA